MTPMMEPPVIQRVLRVVIIDDSVLIQRQLAEVLGEDEGIEVVAVAGDGREGLRLVRQMRPDVVTLDIRLPGMNGLEVLEELGNDPDPPRVVVLTSYPEPAYRLRCAELGADLFLNKAEDFGKLPSLIRAGDKR